MKQAYRLEIYAIAARFKELGVDKFIEELQAIEGDLDSQIATIEEEKDQLQGRIDDLDVIDEERGLDDDQQQDYDTLKEQITELESSTDTLSALSQDVCTAKSNLNDLSDFESRIDDAAGQESE